METMGGNCRFLHDYDLNMKGSRAYCNNLSLRLVISWLLGGWWHWGVVPVNSYEFDHWSGGVPVVICIFLCPPKNTHFYQPIYYSVFVAHSSVWFFKHVFAIPEYLNEISRDNMNQPFFVVSLLLPQSDQFPYTSKHTKGTHGYRRRRAKDLVTFNS